MVFFKHTSQNENYFGFIKIFNLEHGKLCEIMSLSDAICKMDTCSHQYAVSFLGLLRVGRGIRLITESMILLRDSK